MICARSAVIDSGVGGLSVLLRLKKEFPFCEFIYFGDNQNAPYGNRTFNDLYSKTLDNLAFVLSFNVDAIVVACNTISVSVLPSIRPFSPVPIFGIYPPVEREIMQNKSVLLLATDVTTSRFKGIKGVTAIGLSCLVKEIEENLFSLNSIEINKFLPAHEKNFNTVILGCTHFNFIKNQIFNHFCPQKITSGVDSVIACLKNFLDHQKSLEKHYCFTVKFVGNNKFINEKFWSCISGEK